MDDRQSIDGIARTFFSAFDNRNGAPNLDVLRSLFVERGLIIRNTTGAPEVMDVDAFIAPRRAILTDGTLTGFHEEELAARTEIFGNIAQRFCSYRKSGVRNGVPFDARGMKTMQFLRVADGWKLASVVWDDERDGLAVAEPYVDRTERAMLQHFLAAIAYRTQKALRGCRADFASFDAGGRVRTPHFLLNHMDSVLGYACTFFSGGSYRVPPLPALAEEIARFHATLGRLSKLIEETHDWSRISPKQLLQGPLSDAMTHAGQLAMLRRLSGDPVPPENFIFADVSADRLGAEQAMPAAPDADWPERPDGERGTES